MTAAELCLSFDLSMGLTKRGIILVGCCFCWVLDNDDQQVKLIERSRLDDINDLKGEVTFLSHAPTTGELLDTIKTRYPLATIMLTWMGAYWDASFGDYLVQIHKTTHGDTALEAAASLAEDVLS